MAKTQIPTPVVGEGGWCSCLSIAGCVHGKPAVRCHDTGKPCSGEDCRWRKWYTADDGSCNLAIETRRCSLSTGSQCPHYAKALASYRGGLIDDEMHRRHIWVRSGGFSDNGTVPKVEEPRQTVSDVVADTLARMNALRAEQDERWREQFGPLEPVLESEIVVEEPAPDPELIEEIETEPQTPGQAVEQTLNLLGSQLWPARLWGGIRDQFGYWVEAQLLSTQFAMTWKKGEQFKVSLETAARYLTAKGADPFEVLAFVEKRVLEPDPLWAAAYDDAVEIKPPEPPRTKASPPEESLGDLITHLREQVELARAIADIDPNDIEGGGADGYWRMEPATFEMGTGVKSTGRNGHFLSEPRQRKADVRWNDRTDGGRIVANPHRFCHCPAGADPEWMGPRRDSALGVNRLGELWLFVGSFTVEPPEPRRSERPGRNVAHPARR